MNVKPIGAFKSGLIRQVVFEPRGLKIQGPLYSIIIIGCLYFYLVTIYRLPSLGHTSIKM